MVSSQNQHNNNQLVFRFLPHPDRPNVKLTYHDTKTSAKVSTVVNKAKTIQYIIHFTCVSKNNVNSSDTDQ